MALVWSDVNPEFQNKSTKEVKLNGIDAINNSIRNILLIQQGERMRFSAFGSNIEAYLFKNANEQVGLQLMQHVIQMVQRWENRVQVLAKESVITIIPSDNAYKIYLVYVITASSQRGEFSDVLSAGQGT